MNKIQFFVTGIPKPGGSKNAFRNKKTGKIMVVDTCKTVMVWRNAVSAYAAKAMSGREIFTGPLLLTVTFYMPRPKSHYKTGKNAGQLKSNAPFWHTKKPDRTKLLRSTEDAMTGIVWVDDSQVVSGPVKKIYVLPWGPEGGNIGASIMIEEVE